MKLGVRSGVSPIFSGVSLLRHSGVSLSDTGEDTGEDTGSDTGSDTCEDSKRMNDFISVLRWFSLPRLRRSSVKIAFDLAEQVI